MMTFNGSQFQIQGISPLDLCSEFGTPLYVYDAQKIKSQLDLLRGSFAGVPALRINFAVKALTNISVLKYMQSIGSQADTVSMEEVEICLKAGFAPQDIGFTPSGVAKSEIERAVALGVKVHLDSLPLLAWFGDKYGASVPVGIRLNPHIMAGGNLKISTGHERSKFGISIEQLSDVLSIANQKNIVIEGLHQHTGSDIKEAKTFLEVADILFETAKKFKDLQYLDFGGGFKVAYRDGEKGADMPTLGAEISARFNEFCAEYGRPLALWFEPGKFLVSECGSFFSTVNVVKENPSVAFAHLDTGLNHLIRPMFYEAYHKIENISNPEGAKKQYNVVGYICETDNFAEDRELPEVREGDILGFRNAGAYCFTMASQYNSRVRPAEVLIANGRAYLVRERETLEDILNRQILVDVI